eukprot:Phypoly_transcript_01671.p1 GENE.Phypoly_transcript_01671~~Phypoly_transcript_01671.p1  ORF type:complete len:1064 (+),score=159.93 Phypoly_transcript_01671:260-3193(+)
MKIDSNVRTTHGIVGELGAPLEIDVYLPEIGLGFEYQDPHHYFHTSYGSSTLTEYQARDKHKQELAKTKNITIINVPFWWDWSVDSLVATIKRDRPDLLKDVDTKASPVSEDPPQNIIEKFDFDIPDLGAPMLAMHAPQARAFSPVGWWVFEKYDGIRAIWNPIQRNVYTRFGTLLPVPNSFLDVLPAKLWLDGEIWFGREKGTRYLAIKISSSKSISTSVPWDKLQFMVFDAPNMEWRNSPYSYRYTQMKKLIPSGHHFVHLSPHEVCEDRETAETMYFKIRSKDGEGIILRDPDAAYVPGYSRFLYKHKGFTDAEAQVLEQRSKTRYLCRVHKLHLQHNAEQSVPDPHAQPYYDIEMTLDDKFFPENSEIEDLPIGRFVSFRYTGEYRAAGPPINPRIMSIRDDINSWEQVLHGKTKPLVAEEHKRIWKPPVILNDWSVSGSHRKFFDNYASENNFDPLVPENWYKVERKDIMEKGAGLIGGHYKRSISDALMANYPDIGLDPGKFKLKSKEYWNDIANRKRFFDDFAEKRKFDPLISENWYNITEQEVKTGSLDGSRILQKYYGSLYSALQDTYPEIGLEKNKFSAPDEWADIENCKQFFDHYAEEHNFSPNFASNWYSVDFDDIVKQAPGLVYRFNGSIPMALDCVYPRIGIVKSKFNTSPKEYWGKRENQRKFFMYFAGMKGFDPLVPENWYPITTDEIREMGGKFILAYHNGAFVTSLSHAFPELELPPTKFNTVPRNFWAVQKNRRDFLDEFARSKGFDPNNADKWASVSRDDILLAKGTGMLYYFDGSLSDCLLDAYPNIGLKKEKFVLRQRWSDKETRVNFFNALAEKLKFDPLFADNWYTVSVDDASKLKGGIALMKRYNNSIANALVDTFPHIGLDPKKFVLTSKAYWLSASNHKLFFDNFAKGRGFDPLHANNWYHVTKEDILSRVGGSGILKYYSGSLASALMSAYHYTGLNKYLIANFPKAAT